MKKAIIFTAALATMMTSAAQDKPKIYAVSDAHLDTQWNWTVRTTIGEYLRNTITQNLHLLDRYPQYIFNFESGQHYAWFKEYYPLEYELLKKHVASGRWHLTGSSWNANDVNVPSIESFFRNITMGQEFYRNEFGRESTDIFLPDCFGFGYTLPTVAAHCGLIGFSSQKLAWRTNPFFKDGRKVPFNVGLWQGIDGSRIMHAHGFSYGHRFDGSDISNDNRMLQCATSQPLNVAMHYYGTGDVGGSPTVPSIVSVCKGVNGSGPVQIISSTSDQLFKDYLPFQAHPELPVYDGELLIDVHSTGCYTSQTAMKLYNRQNELLGDAAERAAGMAELFAGHSYPLSRFTDTWQRVIWHQFHDDLTGTSTPEVYEISWNDELLALKDFSGILTNSVANVAKLLDTNVKGIPVVMYNPLSYEARDIVEVSVPASRRPATATVLDHNGRRTAAQVVGYADGKAKILVDATVPSVGFAVYSVSLSGSGRDTAPKAASKLENGTYALTFDSIGNISSIVDKRSGKEMVKDGRSIRLALFPENESYSWPAWEILKTTIDKAPVDIDGNVTCELVEDGALRKTVKISKTYGDSRFTQYVRVYGGALADRIDFDNEIDWATMNALVKAEFPLSVSNPKATYDIGLGAVERGNNIPSAYEVVAQQWADLSDASGDYGVTIANDSKYGWDKPDDNTLRLTLLHTPKTKHAYPYQDHNDLGRNEFTYSIIGHDGGLDRVGAGRSAEVLNQRVKAFVTARHPGKGRSLSMLGCNADNVAVKTFKKAEDGKGYIIRLYETAGRPAKATLTFARNIKSAKTADGSEKTIGEAKHTANTLDVELGANAPATFRIDFESAAPSEAEMAAVELPFDKKAFTYNALRHLGDFNDGYTYAAELVPSEIVSDGIRFSINPGEEYSAMSAAGQSIDLPEGKWNKIHFLAAAATDESDIPATFTVGNAKSQLTVPSYTAYVGQWGHSGHTVGYLKDQKVAYVGTHRHSSSGDDPYRFTYMFHFTLDVPEGARSIVLPDNKEIAIFAMTAAAGEPAEAVPASTLFRTAISDSPAAGDETPLVSLLTKEMISGWSGFVNPEEHPAMLIDGNEDTKWCDNQSLPAYVDFDLGKQVPVKGWRIVNAAQEGQGWVTHTCFLQYRNSDGEEWKTADMITGNSKNVVKRMLNTPVNANQLRLLVTAPTQSPGETATRIYELEVYI